MKICAKCNNIILTTQTRTFRPSTNLFYHQFPADCAVKTVPGDLVRRLRRQYHVSGAELANRLGNKTKDEIYKLEKQAVTEAEFKKIQDALIPRIGRAEALVKQPQQPKKRVSRLTETQKKNRIAQGKEIKALRLEKGIKRTELAKKLNLTEDRLEAYERGLSTMSPELVFTIKDKIKKFKKPKKRDYNSKKFFDCSPHKVEIPPKTVTISVEELERLKQAADNYFKVQSLLCPGGNNV